MERSRILKKDFKKALENVKFEMSTADHARNGTATQISKAENFEDVPKLFGIELIDIGEFVEFYFTRDIESDVFEDFVKGIAPYMTEGSYVVDVYDGMADVIFRNNEYRIHYFDKNESPADGLFPSEYYWNNILENFPDVLIMKPGDWSMFGKTYVVFGERIDIKLFRESLNPDIYHVEIYDNGIQVCEKSFVHSDLLSELE